MDIFQLLPKQSVLITAVICSSLSTVKVRISGLLFEFNMIKTFFENFVD